MNDAIIATDANWVLTAWNGAAEAIFGWGAEEVQGRPLEQVLSPKLTSEARRSLAETGQVRAEATYHRKDGEPVHAEADIVALRGKDGYIAGYVSVIRDITERKQAEEALRETRDYLEKLIDYANAPIIVWDPSFTITRFNHAFERLTGRPASEVVGRGLEVLFPEDERAASMEQIARTLRGEFWELIEIPILHESGEVRRVLWNSANITGPDGRTVIATIAQGTDITGRKRAEDMLRKSEEELRKLNRTLKALSDSDQAMMRAHNEADYLNAICKIIVEDCGHSMVWIGLAEEDEAKAGFEEGYLETVNITWADTERGRGPTGTAIRTGKPAVCRNMLTDPDFAPWRKEATRRGYASSIVLPLTMAGKAFGAINIYSRDPDPFSEKELQLLSELADDLAYGITAILPHRGRLGMVRPGGSSPPRWQRLYPRGAAARAGPPSRRDGACGRSLVLLARRSDRSHADKCYTRLCSQRRDSRRHRHHPGYDACGGGGEASQRVPGHGDPRAEDAADRHQGLGGDGAGKLQAPGRRSGPGTVSNH
jgi:PAS domain S-box-containing protein